MISRWIAGQFKQPRGFVGSLVGKIMEKGNAQANLKTVEQLEIKDDDIIYEIGFGPGAAINYILKANDKCIVKGIDLSEIMAKKAEIRNIKYIKEGRCELIKGDFRNISFNGNSYSKIFGVNVIYFWENVRMVAEKILSELKPKGKAVFFMAHKKDLEKLGFPKSDVFNKYEIDQIEKEFKDAGFSKVWHDELKANDRTAYIVQAIK